MSRLLIYAVSAIAMKQKGWILWFPDRVLPRMIPSGAVFRMPGQRTSNNLPVITGAPAPDVIAQQIPLAVPGCFRVHEGPDMDRTACIHSGAGRNTPENGCHSVGTNRSSLQILCSLMEIVCSIMEIHCSLMEIVCSVIKIVCSVMEIAYSLVAILCSFTEIFCGSRDLVCCRCTPGVTAGLRCVFTVGAVSGCFPLTCRTGFGTSGREFPLGPPLFHCASCRGGNIYSSCPISGCNSPAEAANSPNSHHRLRRRGTCTIPGR